MEVGIVGLPRSGKTTLFNALTGSAVTGFDDKAHVGVAAIPDPRLLVIAEALLCNGEAASSNASTSSISEALSSRSLSPTAACALESAASRNTLSHRGTSDPSQACGESIRLFEGEDL